MSALQMLEGPDRLLARGDDGQDLFPSCTLTVQIDGQPTVQFSGKRVRLMLTASARRYVVELDAENVSSVAGYSLYGDVGGTYETLGIPEQGALPQEQLELFVTLCMG